MKTCRILLLLFVSACLRAAVPEGWTSPVAARKSEGNLQFTSSWRATDTLRLLVHQPETDRSVRMDIWRGGFKLTELLPDGSEKELPAGWFAKRDDDDEPEEGEVTIKFREDEWTFYLNHEIRGSIAAPLSLPGSIYWPKRMRCRVHNDVSFHPVARVGFTTDFMIEEGAPNELYPWVIQYGAWHIHTAQQEAVARPETNQQRAKEAPLTADKSPNFYSLKGGGDEVDCVITTGYDIYDNYSLSASMQPVKGEVGLVFFHRDAKPELREGEAEPVVDPKRASFYALTLCMDDENPEQREVRLWRQTDGQRTMLARARVPLFDNQWYLPGVKVHANTIICELDHLELFRVKEALPEGGKFGLFANTPEQIRFDDVTASHFTQVDLTTTDSLAFNALNRPKGSAFNDDAVTLSASQVPLLQLFGRRHNIKRVFSALTAPQGDSWDVGIVGGWQGEDSPYLLFRLKLANGVLTSSLQEVNGEEVTEIDSCEQPTFNPQEPLELMMDASETGRVRCFINGILVHLLEREGDLKGANGLWSGGAAVAFTRIRDVEDRGVFRELVQKNLVFQKDPFMRHWSSPEGQWIAGKFDSMWHKGDFFGDYVLRMPCIPGSDLHTAIPEEQENGALFVEIRDAQIRLGFRDPTQEEPVVQEATLTPEEGKGVETLDYYLHHEGQWAWLEVGGKTLLRQRLNVTLKDIGTLTRVKGMTQEHLSRTKVTRDNIIDEFFNESPHDWLANGGDWQIINRFQCTPSWSHMIDEAPEGLGAFWRKQVFKGDMTLEFYAGTRHEHYDESGNLNCTIMAAETSPGSGYTVACTEWDQNLSQNWTSMYKNGNKLDTTDAYTVPRNRKGLYRKILNPLISQGRPYHGAWFYIKLRKIGDMLEYYFDDERLFQETDPEMIQEGLVGIWTFVHSMTLAQIKITYDHVEPRPFPVERLDTEDMSDAVFPPDPNAEEAPAEETAASEEEAKPEAADSEGHEGEQEEAAEEPEPRDLTWYATVGGFPLDALSQRFWSYVDTVGQSRLTPFLLNSDGLTYRNLLGSGDMVIRAQLPSTPMDNIAGWRFLMKRNAKAKLNFFYTIGKLEGENYTAQLRLFHHISGDTFSDGQWRMAGETEVAPVEEVTPKNAEWTPVTVWIPFRFHRPKDDENHMVACVEGFGIEQLDAISNGIWGNGPGAMYAVTALSPIFYGVPEFDLDEGCQITLRNSLTDTERLLRTTDPAELTEFLNAQTEPGLHTLYLELRKGGNNIIQELNWIVLPEKVPVTVAWDPERPDTIRMTHAADYVDRRFSMSNLIFDSKPLPPRHGNMADDYRLGILPRTAAVAEAMATGTLKLTANTGTESLEVTLPAKEGRVNSAPVWMEANGFSPYVLAFEDGPKKPLDFAGPPRMVIRQDAVGTAGQDANPSSYLVVRNTAYGQVLNASFGTGNFSIAQYPILQFRYRASDMSYISALLRIQSSGASYAQIAAGDYSASVACRVAPEFKMDETWHTWTGMIPDAIGLENFSPSRFTMTELLLRSVGSPDQTGRYSWIHYDDLVLGPAVHSAEQLNLTPTFYDPDGVQTVLCAVSTNETPFPDLTEEQRNALSWKEFAPGATITPELGERADGVYQLFIKARDTLGAESVPLSLPFLLDRKPLVTNFHLEESLTPQLNGTELQIDFTKADGIGAPWRIDQATFIVNGEAQKSILPWSHRLIHDKNRETIVLNHPLVFRKLLDASKDGDEFEFAIDNIVDGAGNTIPRASGSFKVDYASDKTGPAWYSTAFSPNVLKAITWDGSSDTSRVFSAGGHSSAEVVHKHGQNAHLYHTSYYGSGILSLATKWKPSEFPYLAFRISQTNIRGSLVFNLTLAAEDKKNYAIALNAKPPKGALNAEQKIEWKSGVPNRLVFNVKELLSKMEITQEELDKIVITSLVFERSGTQHGDPLTMDDFYILAPPSDPAAEDPLTWVAFDASGVGGLVATAINPQNPEEKLWSHEFASTAPADLKVLREKMGDAAVQWVQFQAKDKAGNLSLPFEFPLVK